MILRPYSKRSISPLGICRIQIKYEKKQLTCTVSVCPENGLDLLGRLDNKLLDILSIKCSTIDTSQRRRDISAEQTKRIATQRNTNPNPNYC